MAWGPGAQVCAWDISAVVFSACLCSLSLSLSLMAQRQPVAQGQRGTASWSSSGHPHFHPLPRWPDTGGGKGGWWCWGERGAGAGDTGGGRGRQVVLGTKKHAYGGAQADLISLCPTGSFKAVRLCYSRNIYIACCIYCKEAFNVLSHACL